MADAVTGLRLPQGDAILGEQPLLTPEEQEVQRFTAIASPVRRGFRAAVNSVGAGALQLAGSIGENLGLRDFAAQRYAEAEDYVKFADAIAPEVRDYRAIKDIDDAVEFAAGMGGQAAATMVPALVAGAAGARLGGLRGAVKGAYAGSLVPNVGEQALRVAGEGTPQERLANALATGGAVSVLDVAVPAAGFRKIAKAAKGVKGAPLGRTVAGATAGEAATEAAQEALGQAGHTVIAPERETSEDWAQVINAALGGAIGGAGFGAGTGGISTLLAGLRKKGGKPAELDTTRAQTPDEVRQTLDVLERPESPEDLSRAPDEMEAVPAWLEEKDAADERGLSRWLDRVKSQPWAKKFTDMTDPDQRQAFFEELKTRIGEAVDKPAVRRAAEKFKGYVGSYKKPEEKQSKVRTALDLAVFDNMLRHLDPEKAQALSPSEKMQLADDLKTYMLTEFAARQRPEGPGEPVERRGFEARPPAQALSRGRLTVFPEAGYDVPAARRAAPAAMEADRPAQPVPLPHALQDLFGDRLGGLFESTDKLLRARYAPEMRKVDYKRGVEAAAVARGGYQTKLEEVVQGSLRDEYLADPSARETAVKEVTRWLTRQVAHGPDRGDWEQFNSRVRTFFGPRAEEVLEAFDAEREDITREYEHFVEQESEAEAKDIAGRLEQNERFRVSREEEQEVAGEEAAEEEVSKDSPYRDERLGVPYEEITEAKKVIEQLRSEYDPRRVSFRTEPVLDAEGNMTGRVTIHAEDAQAATKYSEEQWEAIRDKFGKSGTKFGVITVLRKTDKTDRKPWKVSLPNLVAETMRSIGRAGGGQLFAYDMLQRGLGNLMSDPNFTGFSEKTETEVRSGTEGIKIPQDAIVWVDQNGQQFTLGELAKASREGLRGEERVYWQGVVSDLNAWAREEGGNAELKEYYLDLRRAVEQREPGARELYTQFVKNWAQEREEKRSGFQGEPRKGMVGINAIEDAFYRDRRIEQIKTLLEGRPVREGDAFPVEKVKGPRREELQAELARLQQGLSSTLREDEIEQTARRGMEPEPREYQEETRIPLVGPAAPKPRRGEMGDRLGGETKVTKEPLTPAERRRAEAGKGVFGEGLGRRKPKKKGEPGFSEMNVGEIPRPKEELEAVRDYVKRVLGDDAKLLFADMPHAAGMFQKIDDVEQIVISLRALDPRSVGYHEALHGLMSRLAEDNPRVANVLQSAASSPKVVGQLRKLLKDEPRALEQLKEAEERLAYMYQFWAAGKLEVGPRTETVFQKVKAFVQKALSAWTELSADEAALPKAEEVLKAFHSGELAERSAAGRVLDRILPPRSEHWLARWGDMASKAFFTGDGYIRGFKIPAMTAVADKLFSPPEQQGAPSGMLQTKHILRNQFMNEYVRATEGLTDEQVEKVRGRLTGAAVGLSLDEQRAADRVRKLLKDVFDYMQESGVKVVEWDPDEKEYKELPVKYQADYVPRVFDRQKIVEKMDAFARVLQDHGMTWEAAVDLTRKILSATKADPNESDWTAGLVYYAPSTMARKLKVPDSALRPFLEDDLGAIMYRYINYSVRRGEYAKRFGNQGQGIAEAVAQARQQGATDDQVKAFNQYVQAAEGSLGNDIDPKMRSFFGAVMTYQNLRLLPLALFSSLVDPLGIYVRGGEASEAFKAFARGVRELVSDKKDEARDFAATVGAINLATDEQMMADAYGANFVSGWQRWMNKKLFQLNGMESWNNSMRIVASVAARDFIIRHATKPNEHSARYLAELGLARDDVRIDNGQLELTPAVVDAINKWVDGAVLRPHAGVRPIWMSDPKWMLVSHLKQFTYSFHKTIVARAVHEAKHGNVQPIMTLASYVPFIVAADLLRGLVTPGGADDRRLEEWDLADWAQHGVVRAGITGPGQYALDVRKDMQYGGLGIESVAGPTAQQLVEMLRGVFGSRSMGREALRAIPPVPALNIEGA